MKKAVFVTRGNIEILNQKKAALFASKDAPQEVYPDIEALFSRLQRMDIAVAGGWQAPFEKKLYKNIKMNDRANFIFYLAKDINRLRLNRNEERLLEKGKLLFISPDIKAKRISKSLVTERDELLFAQNNKIVFLYISKGGRLEEYYKQLNPQVFQIYILDHPLNQRLITKNVSALNIDNADILLNL